MRTSWPTPSTSMRLERVVRQQLVLEVLGHEPALDVVAAETERHLRQVVGAEREELGDLGDLVGDERGARRLDHRADEVVDVDAGVAHDRVGFLAHPLLDQRELGLR